MIDDRKKIAILGAFVHEVAMGAYRPSDLRKFARAALERAGVPRLGDLYENELYSPKLSVFMVDDRPPTIT